MRIKRINLYTDQLEANRDFFSSTLGLDLISDDKARFTVRVGWSQLTFSRSSEPHVYHYCFLIPSNSIQEALDWMRQRAPILDTEKGKKIQRFESWNAESFYFHDGAGNLAECIARHDLGYSIEDGFDESRLLGLNEIGMPTADIGQTNKELSSMLGTSAWKGDLHRFGTHGDQQGLFLLPNYKVKNTWFPSDQIIHPEPFEATVEHQGKETSLAFLGGTIEIR